MFGKPCTRFFDVGQDPFRLQSLKDREPRRGSDRVTAKGRPVLACAQTLRVLFTKRDQRTQRHTATEALSQRHRIRGDPSQRCEPLSCASYTGLHLIDNHQRTVLTGQSTDLLQIALGKLTHPGLTLNRFNNHGLNRLIHRLCERINITWLNPLDTRYQRLKRGTVFRLPRHRQRTYRAAVETLLQSHDAGPRLLISAGIAAGQLECRLIGFSTRISEKHGRSGRRLSQFQNLLGQRHLRRRCEEVGDMPQRGDLLRHGTHHIRVPVSQSVDCDTGQQIQVLITVGIPHVRAPPTHQGALRRAEHTHEAFLVAS